MYRKYLNGLPLYKMRKVNAYRALDSFWGLIELKFQLWYFFNLIFHRKTGLEVWVILNQQTKT